MISAATAMLVCTGFVLLAESEAAYRGSATAIDTLVVESPV